MMNPIQKVNVEPDGKGEVLVAFTGGATDGAVRAGVLEPRPNGEGAGVEESANLQAQNLGYFSSLSRVEP